MAHRLVAGDCICHRGRQKSFSRPKGMGEVFYYPPPPPQLPNPRPCTHTTAVQPLRPSGENRFSRKEMCRNKGISALWRAGGLPAERCIAAQPTRAGLIRSGPVQASSEFAESRTLFETILMHSTNFYLVGSTAGPSNAPRLWARTRGCTLPAFGDATRYQKLTVTRVSPQRNVPLASRPIRCVPFG